MTKKGTANSTSIKIKVNNIAEEIPVLQDFKTTIKDNLRNKSMIGFINFKSGDSRIKAFDLTDKKGNTSDIFTISKSGFIYIKNSMKLKKSKKTTFLLKAIALNGAGLSEANEVIINVERKIPKTQNIVKVNFYNKEIKFNYDKNMEFRLSNINKNSISDFWEKISKTKYKALISQLQSKSEELNLNDWATYQLTYKVGQEIYKSDNVANLFTWFALVKMGYDTKVGYSKDKIYLLAIMKHKLYQVAFFKLKGKKYYVLTPNGRVGKVGKIYTYKGNYPKADDKLSFDINKEIKFYSNIKKKDLKFKYYGKNYSVASSYSKDLVDFYGTFPQSDYNIYFNTKNSAPLSNSILRQLQEILKGKSELEAVNILLRFTQTAFAYKTDQKQFDYEKVMFPEETVFYPYSDCEDRSIMFSFLVKNILGLDVVGVKYPDHMATAVEFSSKVSGDGFNYKNKKYVISDPTYVNANAGMAMPQYKNRKFEVISLR
jgi:NifU-like protein involved in Fe-S cluster formation